jgi:hypothetical protein
MAVNVRHRNEQIKNEQIKWELGIAGGGPAARIVVLTDLRGWVVEEAWFEYQSWFAPWTWAAKQDAELVRRFAEIVGCYEE